MFSPRECVPLIMGEDRIAILRKVVPLGIYYPIVL